MTCHYRGNERISNETHELPGEDRPRSVRPFDHGITEADVEAAFNAIRSDLTDASPIPQAR
jgi:hypothetical protein